MNRIYLDANASTPIDPAVADAMRPYLSEAFGNPSSHHWAGDPAREALERARGQVAGYLGCEADEVVFTSGGSESNNLAIKGAFLALRDRGDHIITATTEHASVLGPCRFLEGLGARVTLLPVDGQGRVDPGDVARALTPRTVLLSLMHANNETGTIQPIAEIAKLARERGVLVHTDAAQSAGKLDIVVGTLGVDMLTLAGHKVYAPKGVGALYVRRGVRLEPLVHGAGHEDGRRSGTSSALLAVGLGAACELARDLRPIERVKALRDAFWGALRERYGERIVLNGHPAARLPNTLNVSFVGGIGVEILQKLPEVAASTGAACHSGRVELSPVLAAMGIPERVGLGAIRFSLGRHTTRAEIDAVVSRLSAVLS